MLGKCIKNEFVNRIKQVFGIIAVLIGMAIFTRIIDVISDAAASSVMDMFSGLTKTIYILIIIGALVMTAFLPFLDYRQRFFKDQAYLTHTLPVKVSTMLIARMICDVVTTVVISLSWVVSLCIAVGNFDFYSDIIDFVARLIELFGENTAVQNSLLIALFVLIVIGICFSTLNTIWMTNAAYSFGHAFSKNKKVMSIIGFVAFYIIEMLFMSLVLYICDKTGVVTEVEVDAIDGISAASLKVICQMFVIMDAIAVAMVCAMGAVTNFICKRHLNIE